MWGYSFTKYWDMIYFEIKDDLQGVKSFIIMGVKTKKVHSLRLILRHGQISEMAV